MEDTPVSHLRRPVGGLSRLSAVVLIMLAVFTMAWSTSCQSTYYAAMEQMGVHKRDILVDRVEDARDDQEQAKEQFVDALDAFSAVVNFEGGDLRGQYDTLKRQLDRSEARAEDVRDRIAAVEDVAADLFAEWEAELAQYSNADLRRQSEQTLHDTRSQYEMLIAAMKRAESKMEPVLAAFRDQVLFLKHNLNAQAVASLQGNVVALESDIADLIREMERAIAEADSFIQGMNQS